VPTASIIAAIGSFSARVSQRGALLMRIAPRGELRGAILPASRQSMQPAEGPDQKQNRNRNAQQPQQQISTHDSTSLLKA
jgi:hypothetical protein